ncbi:MAG: hypothetical protein E7600_03970 [Ruminococcaceae bacterium]|nr:hypothetical protein [Oscillospiraceae bacterium]
MKKILSILLAISLLISGNILLTSCTSDEGYVSSKDDDDKSDKGSENVEESDENNEIADDKNDVLANGDNIDSSNENKPEIEEAVTKEKFSGELEFATPFSDGVALANTTENPTTIGINKNGEILFKLDQKYDFSRRYLYNDRFEGGMFILPGGCLCDTNGNVTSPKELGYENFYDVAFEDGYILAKKVEATYDSTKISYSIMNSDFEVLYTTDWGLDDHIQQYSIYYDKLLCLKSDSTRNDDYVFWDLNTSEITNIPPSSMPSETWLKGGSAYEDLFDNKYLDYDDIGDNVYSVEYFINNIAPIIYFNREANKSYFNYINEDGSFVFDPIEIGAEYYAYYKIYAYDSNYAVIGKSGMGSRLNTSDPTLRVYNSSGDFISEINIKDYSSDNHLKWEVSMGDEIITINSSTHSVTYLFDINGNKLF